MNKSTREFYFKNKEIRDFLYGIDKRDERFVFSSLGLIDLETGSKVIKAGTLEKSLLIVAIGELIAFREAESEVYPVGSILGIEQFLFNTPWPEDIVVSSNCRLAKLKHESMSELVSTNALAAIKLQNRIIRQFCRTEFRRKMHSDKLKTDLGVTEKELFVDFGLDLAQTKDKVFFEQLNEERVKQIKAQRKAAATQSGVQTRVLDAEDQQDHKELFSLPYFLTAKHEAIIKDFHTRKPENKEATEEDSELRRLIDDDTCLYKSSFLKEKLVQQADRRKKERKPTNAQRKSTMDMGQKKGANKAPRVSLQQVTEQTLLEQIEELKADLAYRHEQMQKTIQRTQELESDNAELARKVLSERASKQLGEARVNNILNVKELLEKQRRIDSLHEVSGDASSLNLNLLNSVNLQYGNSRANSYAAKIARIWLKKTQDRRAVLEKGR